MKHPADDTVSLDRFSRLNNDLTNLQRDLVKANVELAKAVKRKNEVMGMAAHDLRNPLAVILAYSSFLEKDAGKHLSPTQLEFIGIIKQSSEFMLRLVNDLLDLSSIESGELKLLKSDVDLSGVLRNNVRRNRVLAAKKHIGVDLREPSEALPCACDASKIEQVLDNLLGNAFKYAPGGSQIRVDLRRGAGFATISVQDEGPGIPDADIGRLFEPFCTASVRPRADADDSTGLGLAIARRIVEGHGGHIWVDSKPGHGATFSFTVPLSAG